MAKLLEIETVGLRDAKGRFAKIKPGLVSALRDTHREEGKAMVRSLQAYAPKKTGEFAKGFAYMTRQTGPTGFETIIYYRGKKAFLIPILELGSRSHAIVAKRAKALRFYWERGPEGPGIYFYKSVQHPGTQPTFFISKAIGARYDPMERNFYRRVVKVTSYV